MLVSSLTWATPQPLLAEEYIYFDKGASQKLLIDITTYKDNATLLNEAVKLQMEKINGLEQDKDILTDQASQYKKLYLNENKRANEAEASKPSRFTWFSIGSITTLIVIIASAIAIK